MLISGVVCNVYVMKFRDKDDERVETQETRNHKFHHSTALLAVRGCKSSSCKSRDFRQLFFLRSLNFFRNIYTPLPSP